MQSATFFDLDAGSLFLLPRRPAVVLRPSCSIHDCSAALYAARDEQPPPSTLRNDPAVLPQPHIRGHAISHIASSLAAVIQSPRSGSRNRPSPLAAGRNTQGFESPSSDSSGDTGSRHIVNSDLSVEAFAMDVDAALQTLVPSREVTAVDIPSNVNVRDPGEEASGALESSPPTLSTYQPDSSASSSTTLFSGMLPSRSTPSSLHLDTGWHGNYIDSAFHFAAIAIHRMPSTVKTTREPVFGLATVPEVGSVATGGDLRRSRTVHSTDLSTSAGPSTRQGPATSVSMTFARLSRDDGRAVISTQQMTLHAAASDQHDVCQVASRRWANRNVDSADDHSRRGQRKHQPGVLPAISLIHRTPWQTTLKASAADPAVFPERPDVFEEIQRMLRRSLVLGSRRLSGDWTTGSQAASLGPRRNQALPGHDYVDADVSYDMFPLLRCSCTMM